MFRWGFFFLSTYSVMSKKRKIKKIALKSEVVTIEEEEFDEVDSSFSAEFSKDFRNELAFLTEFKPREKEDSEGKDLEASNEFLKKIHRELARIMHPDLNPNSSDEEFKRMQAAYEKADGATLIEMAIAHGLEIDLDDETLEKIEDTLDERQRIIEDKKESCRWAWCSSDKNENLRSQIKRSMGIDEEAFQEWLKKKN